MSTTITNQSPEPVLAPIEPSETAKAALANKPLPTKFVPKPPPIPRNVPSRKSFDFGPRRPGGRGR